MKKAKCIIARLKEAGYEAYMVGGAVRDHLRGATPHDIDVATSASPEQVKALFERTIDTGIEHGTVMVVIEGQGTEVTTFRTESGYSDNRRPDKVEFVNSLIEDLKRRDFTINAMAYHPLRGLADPFGGAAAGVVQGRGPGIWVTLTGAVVLVAGSLAALATGSPADHSSASTSSTDSMIPVSASASDVNDATTS